MGAAKRRTSSLIFLRISFLFFPRISAAKGSIGIRSICSTPFSSNTFFSSYKSSSGKDSAGSPSIKTAKICSRPCILIKVSISLRHHKDSRNLGEQITSKNSELRNALVIGSARLLVIGSSSLSRNTLSIFFFSIPFCFNCF